MKRLLLTPAIFICSFTYTFCQNDTFTITGLVQDSAYNPIAGAIVKLCNDTVCSTILAFTITNNKGFFELNVLQPRDSLFIEVSAFGYKNIIQKIKLSGNALQPIYFYLTSSYNLLPPINVEIKPAIVQKGDTIVFNAEFYKNSNQQNIEELLKNMPGFQINENGKILFNGKIIDKVLIEQDDLFGNEYSSLTKNVNPDNIEQIEVINNYKDRTDLAKQLSKGNEQVLNLRFKKLHALFGNLNASIPTKYYEYKANAISLIPKAKFVAIGNANSVGYLTSSLMDKSNAFYNASEQETLPYKAATISNILLPKNIDINRIYSNNSALGLFNMQLNISKNFLLKTNIDIERNHFSQEQEKIQTYYNVLEPLVISEKNKIDKKNYAYHVEINPVFTVSNKLQITYNGAVSFNRDKDTSSGFLFLQPSWQKLRQKLFYQTNNLKLTTLILKKSILTIETNINYGRLPEQFHASPFLKDSLFQLPKDYTVLYEDIISKKIYGDVKMRFSTQLNKSTLGVELSFNTNKNIFKSFMQAYDREDSMVYLNNQFINDLNYKNTQFYITPNFSSTIAQKLNYTIAANINFVRLNIPSFNKFTNWYFLPSLNATYQFTEKSGLSFLYSVENNLPNIEQLLNGYIFTEFLRLQSGTPFLEANLNHQFFINYYLLDLLKKGFLVSTGFVYNIYQSPYITNFSAKNIYVLLENNSSNKTNKTNFVSYYLYLQKLVPAIKSLFTLNAYINYSRSFNMYSNIAQKNVFKGSTIKFEYKSVFEKPFNITLTTFYNYNSLHINSVVSTNSPTNELLVKPLVNYNIFKQFFINANANYLFVQGVENSKQHLFLADAGFLWSAKHKRLSVNMSINNIFNKHNFVSNTINPFYYSSTQFPILGRFALVTARNRF